MENKKTNEITIYPKDYKPEMPKGLLSNIGEVGFTGTVLKTEPFKSTFKDAYHAVSHWQISTTENFSNLVLDSWTQSENWCHMENRQKRDNLTYEVTKRLQPNTTYYWRVRYRDYHLKWTVWSQTQSFKTRILMKILLKISLLMIIFFSLSIEAQQGKKPNVFLITLDGVRWQDVFTGIDTVLLNSAYTEDKKFLKENFVGNSLEENRKMLMPFFWNTIVKQGQLHGNRNKDSKVNLTNKMVFSYPGYNEILTGKADDENITSNDKVYNKNVTILETVNDSEAYKGKVAAFGSWDVFPYIINEKRSGVPVNAGYMDAIGDLNEKEQFLNEIQRQGPIIWESVRLDVFTHHFAKEYIKKNHPELVFISYGETDDFAHGGLFDLYIKSMHNTDGLIEDLWKYTQNDPFYKDNTYFIITTDHGRGVGTEEGSKWTDHGKDIKGADQTWMAILGPDVKSTGEVTAEQLFANQIAPTILEALNFKTDSKKMPGKPLNLKIP